MRKIVIEVPEVPDDCRKCYYSSNGDTIYCKIFHVDIVNLASCQACLDATVKERQDDRK